MNEIPLWLRALVAVTTFVGAIAATVASGKVVFGNLSFRSHSGERYPWQGCRSPVVAASDAAVRRHRPPASG